MLHPLPGSTQQPLKPSAMTRHQGQQPGATGPLTPLIIKEQLLQRALQLHGPLQPLHAAAALVQVDEASRQQRVVIGKAADG